MEDAHEQSVGVSVDHCSRLPPPRLPPGVSVGPWWLHQPIQRCTRAKAAAEDACEAAGSARAVVAEPTKVEDAHEPLVGVSVGPCWAHQPIQQRTRVKAAKAENACEAAGSRAGVPRLMGRREWRKLA